MVDNMFEEPKREGNAFWISLIILVIAWIVLAVVFGIFDLQISQIMTELDSGWARFLSTYGEYPGYIIIIVSFLGIIISTFVDRLKKYSTFFFIVLILSLVSIIFVNVTKFIVYRVRFRNLFSDYSNYTPWFASPIHLSLSNAAASFPSGHTAMAFMLLPIIILYKDSPWRVILTSMVIAWCVFVATSRIVVGAHYASDVLFSAMVATITTLILYKLIYFDERKIKVSSELLCPCAEKDVCYCEVN